jgi:hypothetical protein
VKPPRLPKVVQVLLVWVAISVVIFGIAEAVARQAQPRLAYPGQYPVYQKYAVDTLPPLYREWIGSLSSMTGFATTEGTPFLHYTRKASVNGPNGLISQNSLGLRGPEITVEKPANTFRVVVLGGSVAWGEHAITNDTAFWARLQQRLAVAHPDKKIEVVSAGVIAWIATQEMIDLHLTVTRLRPDLVIAFDGYNDLIRAADAGIFGGQPYLWTEADELRDYAILHPLRYWALSSINDLLAQSVLLKRFQIRTRALAAKTLFVEGERPTWELVEPQLPEVSRRFLDNWEGMVKLANGYGSNVFLVLQPSMLMKRQPVWPEDAAIPPNMDVLVKAQEQFYRAVNARAGSIVDARNSWFLDFTGIFENYPEPTYNDLVHPLRNGHELIGDALFAEVERLGLVK